MRVKNTQLINSVGQRISAYRIINGFSQGDLAKMLNVKPGTVSDYERGKVDFNLTTLITMASIFKVTVGELILGKRAKNEVP